MKILPRGAWGALPAHRITPLRWASVRYSVLHWPASMGVKIGHDEATVARWLRSWQRMHMNDRGWSDIAYSHAVDLAGRLWTLRGWDRVEGGVKNRGGHCVSILAVLGSKDTPTPAMLATIRAWQAEADRRAGRRLTRTYHGALVSTDCPGPKLTAWARAGFPNPNPTTPEENDDMPTPKDLLFADIIPIPATFDAATRKKNPDWTPAAYLRSTWEQANAAKLAAAQSLALVRAIAAKTLTPAEIEAAAAEGARQAITDAIADGDLVRGQ